MPVETIPDLFLHAVTAFDKKDAFKYKIQGRYVDVSHQDVLSAVDRLRPLAEAKGCTLSQFALAWCARQPGVTSPIIGPRTMEQLEDNLGAVEVELTDEDVAAVDEIVPPGTFVSPFYAADFGPHVHRW